MGVIVSSWFLLSGERRYMQGEEWVDRMVGTKHPAKKGRRCVLGKGTSFMKGAEHG